MTVPNPPPEVRVREYNDARAFQREAAKLASEGWEIVSQTERTQRPGCLRIVLTGGLAAIFPPKPHIVVSYRRRQKPA